MLNVHAGTMRLLALSLVIGAAAPGIAHADPGFRNVVLASAQDGGPETV
ncbi:MAG: hypothetical protein JWN93_3459, partial [Hyphomicrobiales bacterium]|nr:hypothetical protein [Hyphomicrobiales bacterium]